MACRRDNREDWRDQACSAGVDQFQLNYFINVFINVFLGAHDEQ